MRVAYKYSTFFKRCGWASVPVRGQVGVVVMSRCRSIGVSYIIRHVCTVIRGNSNCVQHLKM